MIDKVFQLFAVNKVFFYRFFQSFKNKFSNYWRRELCQCILIIFTPLLPPSRSTVFPAHPTFFFLYNPSITICSLECVAYWSVVDLPGVTPLEKADSPSLSSYQWSVAPWLGVIWCFLKHASRLSF